MNKLRFRSGQVHLRRVRVTAETIIEPGDLLWLDGAHAKPAAAFLWAGSLAATQAAFAAKFLGIAHQPSLAGETTPISVDIGSQGVYEVDVASSTYEIGQPLGADELANTLMNQQLEGAVSANAIARAAEFSAAPVATLRVTFASAFAACSANVNAALG